MNPGVSQDSPSGQREQERASGSWASSEGSRRSMQANKGRDTAPELALRSAVHRLGLRYRVNRRPVPGIRRTADLVFGPSRVAVFLDGCFWHRCPEHYTAPRANGAFWAAKVERNVERDRETDRLLRDAGWLVLRVWEHDDPAAAAARIREAVDSCLSPKPRSPRPSVEGVVRDRKGRRGARSST